MRALDGVLDKVGHLWTKYQKERTHLKQAIAANAVSWKESAMAGMKKLSKRAIQMGREVILPAVREVAGEMKQLSKKKAKQLKHKVIDLTSKYSQLGKAVGRRISHEKNKVMANLLHKVRKSIKTVQQQYREAVQQQEQSTKKH